MFGFVVTMTAIMILGTYLSARFSTFRYLTVIPTALLIAMSPFCLMAVSPILWMVTGMVLLVALVCYGTNARPRTYLAGTTLGAATIFLVTYWNVTSEGSKLGQARNRFPLESMSERLHFESLPDRQQRKQRPANFDTLAAARDLDQLEEILKHDEAHYKISARRTATLRWLHTDTVEQFVSSPGFGVGRGVPGPQLHILDALDEDSKPIKQPEPDYTPGKDNPETTESLAVDFSRPFGKLHLDSLTLFLQPSQFGYVRDRNNVAGFIPHRFSKLPDEVRDAHQVDWQTARIELISLLKHDRPAVYVSRNLPRMDELRNAPTRQLDEFEQAALPRLQKGEDIIVGSHPERVRMVGSIRATQQCVKCHDAQRSELLGAFSYILQNKRVAH